MHTYNKEKWAPYLYLVKRKGTRIHYTVNAVVALCGQSTRTPGWVLLNKVGLATCKGCLAATGELPAESS